VNAHSHVVSFIVLSLAIPSDDEKISRRKKILSPDVEKIDEKVL
jgi:hypothetical protein